MRAIFRVLRRRGRPNTHAHAVGQMVGRAETSGGLIAGGKTVSAAGASSPLGTPKGRGIGGIGALIATRPALRVIFLF